MTHPPCPADCVQFIGDLILSKSVNNSVVLWKPLVDGERRVYNTHRVPSSILFLREFSLNHCDSWYIRFESKSPYHLTLACGNQRGEVRVWRVGAPSAGDEGDEFDDDGGGGRRPERKQFCDLGAGGAGGWDGDRSTVRMVAFNPHGSQLVAVKDDSTVWMWDMAG